MQLIIQRHPPYSGQAASESLDIALGFAVMDQDCALLFVDDGVWQLLHQQSPAAQKNLAKHFAALPMYGIEQCYCERESLAARGIAEDSLIDGITLLDRPEINALIAKARGVFAL